MFETGNSHIQRLNQSVVVLFFETACLLMEMNLLSPDLERQQPKVDFVVTVCFSRFWFFLYTKVAR